MRQRKRPVTQRTNKDHIVIEAVLKGGIGLTLDAMPEAWDKLNTLFEEERQQFIEEFRTHVLAPAVVKVYKPSASVRNQKVKLLKLQAALLHGFIKEWLAGQGPQGKLIERIEIPKDEDDKRLKANDPELYTAYCMQKYYDKDLKQYGIALYHTYREMHNNFRVTYLYDGNKILDQKEGLLKRVASLYAYSRQLEETNAQTIPCISRLIQYANDVSYKIILSHYSELSRQETSSLKDLMMRSPEDRLPLLREEILPALAIASGESDESDDAQLLNKLLAILTAPGESDESDDAQFLKKILQRREDPP